MALKSGRVGIHPSQVDPITGMLINGPTPGSISFEDLSDAEISDPEAGQTLQYNGTKWENVFASISPVTPATLASLQDVMISDPEDGNYLMYDLTNQKWINSGAAPTPTTIDVTVTIYSAVEDLITYTDINGDTETIQLPSNSDHTTATITIDPSGSNITFTSSVAKNPDDLTADYSKSISITNATTEIKVMPDNSLYWYGYEKETFAVTNYRPSYMGGTQGTPTVTRNKNDFYFTNIGYQGSIIWNDVALGSASSLKVIGNTSKGSTADTHFNVATTANISGNGYAVEMSIDTVLPSSKGLVTVDVSGISNNRGVALAVANCYGNCYALWYE